MRRGAPREGAALLQGLVWCGHCGAKMGVNSYSVRERRKPSYICDRNYHEGAAHTCQSMSSKPIDEQVVALFFEAMVPAQIELAMQVVDKLRVLSATDWVGDDTHWQRLLYCCWAQYKKTFSAQHFQTQAIFIKGR